MSGASEDLVIQADARDFRRILDEMPMSRTQVAGIAITMMLSALDGYDVLSVTFAAPAISQSWGVGRAALGVVLSAGLAGMAVGSLALAPLADVVGRRLTVLGGLALMAAGSLLCAFAHTVPELAAWRIVTGLGIGVMVAVITPVAAEFANARWRSLAVSAMAVGYPVGGTVGGLTAAALLRLSGWPAVFVAGAVAAGLLLPAVLLWLPEPPAFLLTRRRPGSLRGINSFLARCGRETLDALPPSRAAGGMSYLALFAPGCAGTTLRITLVNLLFVVAVYYLLSWLPQLVADTGFRPSTASFVSAAANVFGVVGGISLGWMATRAGPARLAAGAMLGLAVSMLALGYAPASLPLLTVAAGLCGFFLFAGIAGLYATVAITFGTAARASGAGFVIGIGRIGSALGPFLAGSMFAAGLTRGQVSLVFALSAGAAGLLLALGRSAARRGGTMGAFADA